MRTYETVLEQLNGVCTGYFLFGQNPAVGSANARMQRLGMANLDWLVIRDLSLIESATWWKDGREIETRAATCGSHSIWDDGSGKSWPPPPTRSTARCSTSPGSTRSRGRWRSPTRRPCSPRSTGRPSACSPAAGVAAASALTGLQPAIGRAATIAAAVTGPGVAAYTSALLADTAVPAWHEAHRELPYLFVSSAATAAGGLGLALVPPREAGPARNLALIGAGAELTAKSMLLRRLGPTAEPYQSGRAGRLMEVAEILTAAGLTAAALGGRNRLVAAAAGTALVASSAFTRFGIFYAGRESARDPRYTIVPQAERARQRA